MSVEFYRKKEIQSSIRHSFVEGVHHRKESEITHQLELAQQYRQRKDSLKNKITERLQLIESMEVKERQLMHKLQTTIQLQNEKSHNYLRLTGQEQEKKAKDQ